MIYIVVEPMCKQCIRNAYLSLRARSWFGGKSRRTKPATWPIRCQHCQACYQSLTMQQREKQERLYICALSFSIFYPLFLPFFLPLSLTLSLFYNMLLTKLTNDNRLFFGRRENRMISYSLVKLSLVIFLPPGYDVHCRTGLSLYRSQFITSETCIVRQDAGSANFHGITSG